MVFRIAPPEFAAAVSAVDRGDFPELQAALMSRPELLSETADLSGDTPGAYFEAPRLLWFIAENPVRNGVLPGNICDVTQLLLSESKRLGVSDIGSVASYTLALVASGRIARESGHQTTLIETLVRGGADAGGAVQAALAHSERAAAVALQAAGAPWTVLLAAGLGAVDRLKEMSQSAVSADMQSGLAVAVMNGQADAVSYLLGQGADPNQYSPDGLHAHATPLHQAALAGDEACVRTLLVSGALADIRDTSHNATAADWAQHAGHSALAKRLRTARVT